MTQSQKPIEKIRKRDGSLVDFEQSKITRAIFKALSASGQESQEIAEKVSNKVADFLQRRFREDQIPEVEQVQDIIEEVLMLEELVETAKAYILYREQRRVLRETEIISDEAVDIFEQYIGEMDWQVKENANMAYSLQGLNHYAVSVLTKRYWLNKVYPKYIREAYNSGDMHIHDLDCLATYCNGWDLYDLLLRGFGGVAGKVETSPAKHFRVALGQVVNFFYTLQGECFSKDTQVLTDSGWKYFYDVVKSDQIFTLNNQTNRIELQAPLKFYEFDYNGELYNFKTKKLDLMVTPNHNMVVDQYCPGCSFKQLSQFQEQEVEVGNSSVGVLSQTRKEVFAIQPLYYRKFIKAKDFNANQHFIPKQSVWAGEEKEFFELPSIEIKQYRNFGKIYETIEIASKKISINDWVTFFGFFLAEGNTYKRTRKREGGKSYHEYCVRIFQNQGQVSQDFEVILQKLPFNYRKKITGNKITFEITDKQLFSYLEQFGKSDNKFIPNDIKDLPKEQLKVLFDWMMKGDGHISNGLVEYSTKSQKLADDFQEIVLKLGWSANIYKRTKGKFSWFDVGVSMAKHFRFQPESVQKVPYQDKVYCLEVPNHTLYVRRNGKACWSGNSAGAQALSSIDTLLAPFIRYDNMDYAQVKQAMQEFLFNCAVPTRVGFQTPFSNVTLDVHPSPSFAKQPVIIGGKPQKETYAEFQEEMNMFNNAFFEVMMQGDKNGRPFTFPIPTINITKDFPWDDPKLDLMWQATAKYGICYFTNFIQSEMKPEDVRSMCLDGKEEVLIRNTKKIKRLTIKEIAENYKTEDFDQEGWAECNKEKNLEVLSLNPETLKTEWVAVERFFKITDQKSVQITTADGKSAVFSQKHPIAVYTLDGIQMKFSKDIRKGDYLITLKKANEETLSKEYQQIEDLIFNEDLAKILGYFTADGNYLFENRKGYTHFGEPRGMQFTFKTGEKENLQAVKELIKKVFGSDCKEKQDPRYNTYYLYLYNTQVSRKLYNAGFKKYGRLPQMIFNSPFAAIQGFLDFYFKGDGYAKRQEIHINDLELSRDLVLLYSMVGQPVTYKLKKRSQRIYLQHDKGKIKMVNGWTNNPLLSQQVPGWMANTYKVPGLVKSRMVGFNTLQKYNALTEQSLKIQQSDIYLVGVKEVETKSYKKPKVFYDLELAKHHLFVHSLGQVSFNCCRLRLDNKELYKRGGGYFGANPLTGSIGVVTINLPRLGYLTKTKKEFFEKLASMMDVARDSLEIKRKALEDLIKKGLYPYSRVYLSGVEKMRGKYFGNHFSTIGLLGLNESLLNFMGEDIGSKNGRAFALEVLDFMRDRIIGYQKETDNLYNLEATPAEGTSHKLALKDQEKCPGIIQAGTKEAPYYTNSSQLPVNYTDDIFHTLELQDELQCKYTGGTVQHLFLGEQITDISNMKALIKKVFETFHLPYITLTPTFSICPSHGYIAGEHWTCPKCTIDQPCEVYSRVVGYIRPVQQWHKGKAQEFKERKSFQIPQIAQTSPIRSVLENVSA